MRLTADQFRDLTPEKKAEEFEKLSSAEALSLIYDWRFFARKEQLLPKGNWSTWLYLAGRGAGKTRTGAETVRQWIKSGHKRVGLIAPTAADVRDVMVEGESGILAVCPEGDTDNKGAYIGKPLYEPSKRRLTWATGQMCSLYSADEPERLRGPQHEKIWADELCAWRRPEAWDLAMFGLRIGSNPQAFISTTPKPKKIIIDIVKDSSTYVTKGSTYSNRANLSPKFFEQVVKKYEGSRLGQQELMGLLLEEAEGALWSRKDLDDNRISILPQDDAFYFVKIVVAVDPATTANEHSNEVGIVVAGLGNDGKGYLLADYSSVMTPKAWAAKVKMAFTVWQADVVVAEGNQGGEMVRHTIHTADKNIPVRIVHASRGKIARAEPVSALYEQHRVKHVGSFNDLEDQLCTWEPLSGDGSPDRLDALVWAFTHLMVKEVGASSGKLTGFY